MQIRAITLHQPFASFIAIGLKRYETRSWPIRPIPGTGKIAIHAGKAKLNLAVFEGQDILRVTLERFGCICNLPRGCVVAVAQVTSCERITEKLIRNIHPAERLVGHWKPGRWAWKLENVRKIGPYYCRGYQRIWKWICDSEYMSETDRIAIGRLDK